MPRLRPLYRSLAQTEPAHRETGNRGLWYEKYCDRWQAHASDHWTLSSEQNDEEAGPKLDWILAATRASAGDQEQLEEAEARVERLAERLGGETLPLRTAERLVTGLGLEHPVENGFAWHQTLGTPYLPGSSLKGLVRAWARDWLEEPEDEIARILGHGDGVGSVQFLDALPTRRVRLEADVMTPHYGPYHADGEIPGDWHAPVPIPFLTVAADQHFLFALLPRRRDEQHARDLATAAEWLTDALIELGAGAKTAIGLGRFDFPLGAQPRAPGVEIAQEAQRPSGPTRSELHNELLIAIRNGEWATNKKNLLAEAPVWLARIEQGGDRDALAKLREILENHDPGIIANPHDTKRNKKTKKIKPKYKDAPIALALRIRQITADLENDND